MDIWLLVIGLGVIAIVLLGISIFVGNDDEQDAFEEFDAMFQQQSQELYDIKQRLNELEAHLPAEEIEFLDGQAIESTEYVETEEVLPFSDEQQEEIIQLYSQGYTMQEISQQVGLNTATVQFVIDDYIENR